MPRDAAVGAGLSAEMEKVVERPGSLLGLRGIY